jgi:hypothetical protein
MSAASSRANCGLGAKTMTTTLDDVLAAVLEIKALLEGRRAGGGLSRADKAQLEALLPVVAGVFGSKSFLIKELLQTDAAGLKLVLGSSSAKALGRLLRRGEGHTVAGLVVERLGQEGGTAIWKISKVVSGLSEGSETPAVSRRDPGGGLR